MVGLSQVAAVQPAVHAPASFETLDAGWKWALDKAGNINGFYIGYAIEQNSDSNICLGKHSHGKTLYELLYSTTASEKPVGLKKQVGILFRYDKAPEDRYDFRDIDISSMAEKTHIKDLTIFWLGLMNASESVVFLETCFDRVHSDKQREAAQTGVAIHGPDPKVFNFLKRSLTGNYSAGIRENAAFWMGMQKTDEAAKVLINTVHTDKSLGVRKNAVFGLYLVETDRADEALIDLAKKGKEKEIRKKAIFWLGQRAVKRTAGLLQDVIEDESDTEIQESAVFALSQHPDGVSRLINISRTHRSLAVRKRAIFWLGQSDDPRALDAILSIINNKPNN
jgi:hypothetical protein